MRTRFRINRTASIGPIEWLGKRGIEVVDELRQQLVPYEGEVTPRAVVGKKISGKKIVRRISL